MALLEQKFEKLEKHVFIKEHHNRGRIVNILYWVSECADNDGSV